jgi:hypothetical protein
MERRLQLQPMDFRVLRLLWMKLPDRWVSLRRVIPLAFWKTGLRIFGFEIYWRMNQSRGWRTCG